MRHHRWSYHSDADILVCQDCAAATADPASYPEPCPGTDEAPAALTDDQVAEVLTLVSGLADGLLDNAERFTCGEAESIATILRLLFGEAQAAEFLATHADGDDAGDDHGYQGCDPVGGCSVPGHSSLTCFARYLDLENDGDGGPLMTFDEWRRI